MQCRVVLIYLGDNNASVFGVKTSVAKYSLVNTMLRKRSPDSLSAPLLQIQGERKTTDVQKVNCKGVKRIDWLRKDSNGRMLLAC